MRVVADDLAFLGDFGGVLLDAGAARSRFVDGIVKPMRRSAGARRLRGGLAALRSDWLVVGVAHVREHHLCWPVASLLHLCLVKGVEHPRKMMVGNLMGPIHRGLKAALVKQLQVLLVVELARSELLLSDIVLTVRTHHLRGLLMTELAVHDAAPRRHRILRAAQGVGEDPTLHGPVILPIHLLIFLTIVHSELLLPNVWPMLFIVVEVHQLEVLRLVDVLDGEDALALLVRLVELLRRVGVVEKLEAVLMVKLVGAGVLILAAEIVLGDAEVRHVLAELGLLVVEQRSKWRL